jgi:uncharacterized membrane-anchored protein
MVSYCKLRFLNVFALAIGLVSLAAGSGLAEEAGPALDWARGPGKAPIGSNLAEIDLGEGYVFLDAANTKRFLELNQNPVGGNEMATVAPASESEGWFLIFEYDEIGYVKDDEKDQLDAESILAAIREGTAHANEQRKSRGWPTMEIIGWHEQPRYDTRTNNLTWSIVGSSEGRRTINRMIKLLGRRGVMTATLVSSPEELPQAAVAVDKLLDGYAYRGGSTYAEFVPGKDKLAQVGLTALVVGGAGAAVLKSGLLARLWKFIAIGVAAGLAGLKRLFGRGSAGDETTAQA